MGLSDASASRVDQAASGIRGRLGMAEPTTAPAHEPVTSDSSRYEDPAAAADQPAGILAATKTYLGLGRAPASSADSPVAANEDSGSSGQQPTLGPDAATAVGSSASHPPGTAPSKVADGGFVAAAKDVLGLGTASDPNPSADEDSVSQQPTGSQGMAGAQDRAGTAGARPGGSVLAAAKDYLGMSPDTQAPQASTASEPASHLEAEDSGAAAAGGAPTPGGMFSGRSAETSSGSQLADQGNAASSPPSRGSTAVGLATAAVMAPVAAASYLVGAVSESGLAAPAAGEDRSHAAVRQPNGSPTAGDASSISQLSAATGASEPDDQPSTPTYSQEQLPRRDATIARPYASSQGAPAEGGPTVVQPSQGVSADDESSSASTYGGGTVGYNSQVDDSMPSVPSRNSRTELAADEQVDAAASQVTPTCL